MTNYFLFHSLPMVVLIKHQLRVEPSCSSPLWIIAEGSFTTIQSLCASTPLTN